MQAMASEKVSTRVQETFPARKARLTPMQAKAASAFPTLPVRNPRTPQISPSIVVVVFNGSLAPTDLKLPPPTPRTASSSKIVENLFI